MTRTPDSHSTRTHAKSSASTAKPPKREPKDAASSKDSVEGEGNYAAAHKFNEAERKFVASGKVPAAARAAEPTTEAERQAMLAAENEGKRRAKK